jgi:hypothetical protein
MFKYSINIYQKCKWLKTTSSVEDVELSGRMNMLARSRAISPVSIELKTNMSITRFDPDDGDGENPRKVCF